MVKGTKLSLFEKVEITALKRVGKSQREISKALAHKIIYNYRKVQISMEQENRQTVQKNYHHNSREEYFEK